MSRHRFGPHFRIVFGASLLQELSFSLMVHVPGHLDDLGATESRIGLLYAVSALLAIGGRPALGKVLDLLHRRTVILALGATNTAVLVALVAADSWGPGLWALFIAQRVLQISIFTAMLTYAADSLPVDARTRGLALFGLSGLVPIAVGGVLGDVVVAAWGFDALFLLAAAGAGGSWLLVTRLPRLTQPAERPRRGFWAALSQADLLPLWLATFCFAIGLETVFSFIRVYIEDRGVGSAGLFLGLYGATAAAVRLVGGPRYDRFDPRPFVTAALVGYAVGMAVLATGSLAGLVGAALVSGAAHGAIFPMLSSQVVTRARTAERGSAMAIFTSVFDVALLVGAPAIGFLIEARGYATSFAALAAVQAVGAVAYLRLDRRPVTVAVA